MEYLLWVKDSAFITWVRESTSLLGYTLYLAGHTIGLVFLVGPNLLIAARILGVAPRLPLQPMRSYIPIINTGLAITVVTGTVLFFTAPDGFVKNKVFLTKILFIVFAIIALKKLLKELYGTSADPDTRRISVRAYRLTATTVVCWTVAVIAGRLTAYSAETVYQTLMVVGVLAAVLAAVLFALRGRAQGATVEQGADKAAAFAMSSAVKGGK